MELDIQPEQPETKAKKTQKGEIAELQSQVKELSVRIDALVNAIRNSAHAMGWPRDLLTREGIIPFSKEERKKRRELSNG